MLIIKFYEYNIRAGSYTNTFVAATVAGEFLLKSKMADGWKMVAYCCYLLIYEKTVPKILVLCKTIVLFKIKSANFFTYSKRTDYY